MNMKYAKRSEDTEQIQVINWAHWNIEKYPELKWLHHIPNGGRRDRVEAAKLKEMGVKAGVSDLCLPYPKGIYCGLYIEMKYGNNRKTDSQKEFLTDMAAAGHYAVTCYSMEDAVRIITEYLELPANIEGDSLQDVCCAAGSKMSERCMGIPNNSIIKDGRVM
jgi:hypothetical protein